MEKFENKEVITKLVYEFMNDKGRNIKDLSLEELHTLVKDINESQDDFLSLYKKSQVKLSRVLIGELLINHLAGIRKDALYEISLREKKVKK